MLQKFYPDEYRESAYGLDYEGLCRQGYKGIIFDIDNTLVPHGAPADAESIALFKRLRGLGYSCVLLSNNKEPRVKSFADEVGALYIYKAGKPSPAGYRRAMERMGTNRTNTLFVGDQLYGYLGSKNAGVRSILVKPINPKEEIQIVLKRYLERIVLYFYRKKVSAEGKEGGA